ncbi:Unannotated, partial [Lentimonas sp. CC6]
AIEGKTTVNTFQLYLLTARYARDRRARLELTQSILPISSAHSAISAVKPLYQF